MSKTISRLFRPLAAIALAGTTLPAHAQTAQITPAAMPNFYAGTKTEAILGGSSALAAILASQSAGRAESFVPATYASSSVALSFVRPPLIRTPFATTPAPTFAPASPDRPDVFNSVALPVSHTPLDARWARVAHSTVGGRAGAFAASLVGSSRTARLEAVNTYVNRHVRFVDDIRQYGVADYWSPAAQTLAHGRGDCEDYAIAKMAMLRRAGFADRDLYLVILKDLVRRADHAVLVVRSEGHFRVLDNGTDQIIDSNAVSDYRPMLTFNVAHAYTHGYRREAVPPVTIAMAEVPAAPATPAAGYQTASAYPTSGLLPSMIGVSANR